ncbi:unnamed protein product [Blepharisma stoltei]|uniref:Uncharacterized protein n=1 Tax=Blepharisma stoltei TaxID=1481888 RepID=A0AAU9K4K1_9CILI|nr:unnamed protein product [Blepharisma stoltei]
MNLGRNSLGQTFSPTNKSLRQIFKETKLPKIKPSDKNWKEIYHISFANSVTKLLQKTPEPRRTQNMTVKSFRTIKGISSNAYDNNDIFRDSPINLKIKGSQLCNSTNSILSKKFLIRKKIHNELMQREKRSPLLTPIKSTSKSRTSMQKETLFSMVSSPKETKFINIESFSANKYDEKGNIEVIR